MAKDESFDITTGCDLQEVDNAVNQAVKEITGRFDFKGVMAEVEFNRADEKINIHTTDEFKLDAIWQVLVQRLISRQVPVKNLKREEFERAGGDTVKQTVSLVQSIDADTSKKITSHIREMKLKKVKTQQQGDSVRVTSPSRDELQAVQRSLKEQDWEVELSFGNYR